MWGVIFDLDGTLLDTLEDLTDATNYALRQFGCPERSSEYIRSIIGNGALRQITLALPELGPEPKDVLTVYKAYYNSHCNVKTRPYPGVPEALAALGKKYPLAIVTNKPHSAAAPLCESHFPGVMTLGETQARPRKPAPDMVFEAMRLLGVEKCVYVGDSEVDLRTAENAGLPCLCVTWGLRERQQLIDAGATNFCDRAEDLPAAVEKCIRQNT